MKITRRAALKSSALAASALALGSSRLFSQAAAALPLRILLAVSAKVTFCFTVFQGRS